MRRKVPITPGLQTDAESRPSTQGPGRMSALYCLENLSLCHRCGCVPEMTSSSPQCLLLVFQEREKLRPLRETKRSQANNEWKTEGGKSLPIAADIYPGVVHLGSRSNSHTLEVPGTSPPSWEGGGSKGHTCVESSSTHKHRQL